MSVANTKDQGNKGNNMPYQLKNLLILGRIAASIAPPGGIATETTLAAILAAMGGAPGQRTPTIDIVVGAGLVTIPAGTKSVTIFNSGANDAQVQGKTIKKGLIITFDLTASPDTLGPITYDALTSELTVTIIP
jgi:hypothetical protein